MPEPTEATDKIETTLGGDGQGDQPKGEEPKGDEPKGDAPKGDEPKGDEPKGGKKGEEPDAPKKGDEGDDGDEPEGAPDEYEDFELPEGFQGVDETFLTQGKEAFKELNLTQDQAQKLVSMYAENLKASAEGAASQWRDTLENWAQETQNDKEIGGDEYKANLGIAMAVMSDKAGFATAELREAMNTYGFGSHPEVVRFVARIGKVLDQNGLLPKEDRSIGGRPSASKEGDRASRMYPSMTPKS